MEKEAELLEQFRVKAAEGQAIEIAEIKAGYEEVAGHTIGSGQIYRVLHRHNWRNVMPHPKKERQEVIEASKKLKQKSQS